jgi:chromosome segregation ATPase
MLASFLTYEHGLGLKEELQEEYEKEEERRHEEEKKRLLEQLRAMKHRIRESGEGVEEYMLKLEKANRMLQEDREGLIAARQEIENLRNGLGALEAEKVRLNEEIIKLGGKIEELKAENEATVDSLVKEHQGELEEINTKHQREKAELVAQAEEQIGLLEGRAREQAESYLAEKEKIKVENARVVESIRAMWQAEVEGLKGQIFALNGEVDALKGEAEELIEKHRISEARLTALRSQHGLIGDTEDFTSEAIFTEMERQLDAFVKFFKKQWGITKKAIKKRAKEEYRASLKAESHKDVPTDNENAQE